MNKNKIIRLIFIKLPIALILLSILWVILLKWVPVWVTPLMISRSIEFKDDDSFRTHKKWVRIDDISQEMIKAVIASEDNLFNEHHGFDWQQIRMAVDEHKTDGKKLRGASTISQQTAKNVFLLPNRSVIRKGLEAYFTILIELLWGKERIMEVYLNVAEMGKGIYGAQAAAEQHFNKNASELKRRESCLIAACLPGPLKRNASAPSEYISKRASKISALIPKIAYPDWIENNNSLR